MDQALKDVGLGTPARFGSLNGDNDDDAFSEVAGISRRSLSWCLRPTWCQTIQ